MRKYIYYLTTIAIIMLFGACSNDVLFNENDQGLTPNTEGVISLTATMPSNPTTRVALTQEENLAIKLTWEVGDQLELVFVQKDIKIKQTVTVGGISSDRKNASFDIIIPSGITGNFDLYGVYGGGGVSVDNPTLVKLPTKAGTAGSLASVKERKDVMLYFASKDLKINATEASVNFKHLGSLISIMIKNTGSETLTGLKEMRLTGIGENANWAYNNGEGGKTYNLVTGKFDEINSGGNYISYSTTDMSISAGASKTFWYWTPMVDKTWPKLKLEAVTPDNNVYKTSTNNKPEATIPYTAGMVYYYAAEWNGANLEFKDIEVPTAPVYGLGIKMGSEQVLWAKKLKEDLGIDTLQVTGGMAVTKDYVVLNTRGLKSIYLNRMTGEKLGTINMGSIIEATGLNNFYNTADDDGNILLCNLAPNAGSFKIWKIKDVTSAPVLFIEHDEGLKLGRKISIKGSIDKDAIITAPIYDKGHQFLRWQVKNGALVSTTPEKITISGIEGVSWNAHSDIVYTDASDKNSDYFAAYYTQPYKLAWVDGKTNIIKAWGPDNTSNWIVNAVDYTVFNNRPYVVQNSVNSFTWGGNDTALLYDASSTESFAVPIWAAPVGIYGGKENGNGLNNGNGTGDVALKVSENGLHLHLYFMFTNGQIACMQFDAKTE